MAGTRTIDIQPLGARLSGLVHVITKDLEPDGIMGAWTWKGSVADARCESLVVLHGQVGQRIWLTWAGPDIARAAGVPTRHMPRWALDVDDETIVIQAVDFVRPLLARIQDALAVA